MRSYSWEGTQLGFEPHLAWGLGPCVVLSLVFLSRVFHHQDISEMGDVGTVVTF